MKNVQRAFELVVMASKNLFVKLVCSLRKRRICISPLKKWNKDNNYCNRVMAKKKYIPPTITRYPIYRESPMLCTSFNDDTIPVDNNNNDNIQGDSNIRYRLLDEKKWD